MKKVLIFSLLLFNVTLAQNSIPNTFFGCKFGDSQAMCTQKLQDAGYKVENNRLLGAYSCGQFELNGRFVVVNGGCIFNNVTFEFGVYSELDCVRYMTSSTDFSSIIRTFNKTVEDLNSKYPLKKDYEGIGHGMIDGYVYVDNTRLVRVMLRHPAGCQTIWQCVVQYHQSSSPIKL